MIRKLGLSACLLLIIGLWIICPIIVTRWYGIPKEPGSFGDIFGAVNALFAGLAFFGIIVTILLQRLELQQNTVELRNSATALGEQVMLMRLSAKLSALPELIQQEKLRLWTIDKKRFKDAPNEAFTSEQLSRLIEEQKKDLVDNRVRAEAIKTKLSAMKQEDYDTHAAAIYGEPTPWDILHNEQDRRMTAIQVMEASIPTLDRLHKYVKELDTVYGEIDSRSHEPTNINA